MKSALKAEIRKLLTARSTYAIIGSALLLDIFAAGFIEGYKLAGADLLNPFTLQSAITTIATVTSIFGVLIGILLMTHEYRYHTILYSLTSRRRRLELLVAKIIVVTLLSLLLTALLAAAAPLFTLLGVHLAGNTLATQSIAYDDIVWRVLFYGWGYAMAGLLLATLIRSQVGTIITLFIVPGTVEGILSIFLKDNASYLPFSSLSAVIAKSTVLSYGQAALVFLTYLAIAWLVAAFLFSRRDAD